MKEKFFSLYNNFDNLIENIIGVKSRANKVLNLIVGITVLMSIFLLFLIIFCDNKRDFYVPFALTLSITIAIITIKINQKNQYMEEEYKKIYEMKSNLHMLITNLNILRDMYIHLANVVSSEVKIQKYQTKRIQNKFDEILSLIYQKESLIYLNPEEVKLLEDIQRDGVLINGQIDYILEKLPSDKMITLSKSKNDNLQSLNKKTLDSINKLQDLIVIIIDKRYEPYKNIISEETSSFKTVWTNK